RDSPGSRRIHFDASRAASVVDRLAGPDDAIAIDGALDTWSYPAFGAALRRPIFFLPSNQEPVIPPAAKWVIVDRAWHIHWGAPGFHDMSQFYQYAGRGKPTARDVRVLDLLGASPRYRRVFYKPDLNQAVFERLDTPAPSLR